MTTETELKLRMRPQELAALDHHPVIQRLARGRVKDRELTSTYFDTPDLFLRKNGMALRIRKVKNQLVQTLKAPMNCQDGAPENQAKNPSKKEKGSQASSLLQVMREYETKVRTNKPDLSLVPDHDLKALFAENKVADHLLPAFTTSFRRRSRVLSNEDWQIELAQDEGQISAAGHEQALCEAELELLAGSPARLYEVALSLCEEIPFHLEERSKAARGYNLTNNNIPTPRKARRPQLSPEMNIAEAWALIVSTCLLHLRANEGAVWHGTDPEGVHQMRVAVRRLRSALSVFGKVLSPAVVDYLREELRWLQQQLGPARDWDVFITETVADLASRHGEAAQWSSLLVPSQRMRKEAYAAAHAVLADQRYTSLLLRLHLWLEDESWIRRRKKDAPLLADFAATALSKRARRLNQLGDSVDSKDEAALHQIRIAAKKLRYAMEFFQGLYPKKSVSAYLGHMVRLQDLLGALNDAAVGRGLLDDLRHWQEKLIDFEAARAMGFLSGWQAATADDRVSHFAEAWREYRDAKPFW